MIEKEFNLSPNEDNGLYRAAMGGTEMMYNRLTNSLPKELLDNFQIICSRVRELSSDKKKILWLTDTYDDPENAHLKDPKNHDNFDKIVFVSYSQFLTYYLAYEIPYSKSLIIENGIEPIENISKPTDRVNLIYHTTPHRGLGLLVPAFEFLAQKYEFIHLDVFSNFDIYGWPKRNEPFEPLFEKCRTHPRITYHGTQPNQIVREALAKSHIFAYPSIWPETSCISAIEAMSANCSIVCPDLGALPETVLDKKFMYRYHENPQTHLQVFAAVLEQAILNCWATKSSFTNVRELANLNFSWDRKSQEWQTLLENML